MTPILGCTNLIYVSQTGLDFSLGPCLARSLALPTLSRKGSGDTLASYPGSLPVRGRKREPGTHCMRMCKKTPEFGRFVISPYSFDYE